MDCIFIHQRGGGVKQSPVLLILRQGSIYNCFKVIFRIFVMLVDFADD